MLVESNYDKNVIAAGIFFTKDNKLRLLYFEDKNNKRKYICNKELDEGLNTLYEVRKNINQKKFPRNEQFLCRYCTYSDICYKDSD